MSAEHRIPDDLRVFAEELVDRQTGVLARHYTELAALLFPAKNVRSIPAQRFTAQTLTIGGEASALTWLQVIGRREDVKSVTLRLNTYYEADPGPDVVRVGPSADAVQSLATSALLNAQLRELVVDVNESDVWIGIGADGDAGASVSIVIEEFDPNAIQGSVRGAR